jgi:hypothetical protein
MTRLDKATIVGPSRAFDFRVRTLGGIEPLAGHDLLIALRRETARSANGFLHIQMLRLAVGLIARPYRRASVGANQSESSGLPFALGRFATALWRTC